MFKITALILSITFSAYSAEITSSYATFEKQTHFQPNLKTHPVDKLKREASELEQHPVYKPEDYKNERRAKIEPVQPTGPVVKHERMLADQPVEVTGVVNPNDQGYVYSPGPEEIAYPDIPYAPGFGYEGYPNNRYDVYGNSPSTYYMEPDTSPFSLLWSQVPDARTFVSYVSRFISWTLGSIFMIFLGSLLTVGVCSYTNVCTIAFNDIGPIHEEMRSLMTPEKLNQISTAAKLVKTAIDTYQEKQTLDSVKPAKRRRRAIFKLY